MENIPVSELQKKPVILKIVIIFFAIAAVIIVVFFFTKQFLSKNSKISFFPPEFDQYAVGEDAPGFLIIRNDDKLKNFLKNFNLPIQNHFDSFQNALFVGNKNSGKITLQFTNEETVNETKNFISTQPNYLGKSIDFSAKDNFLTITQKGTGTFEGSFYDNPHFKGLDSEILDSQIILFIDSQKIPDASISHSALKLLLIQPFSNTKNTTSKKKFSGILPIASAGILSPTDNPSMVTGIYQPSPEELTLQNLAKSLPSLSKDNILFLKIDDSNLNIGFHANIYSKKEFMSSPTWRAMENDNEDEIAKFYQEAISTLDDSTPDLENILNEKFKNSGSPANGTVSYKDMALKVKIEIPLKDFQKFIEDTIAKTSKAPQKARDIVRKADVSKISKTIIASYLETSSYPTNSKCIDEIAEIQSAFTSGSSPSDPDGSRSFGTIKCEKGYYYQVISDGYIIWAALDDEANGNFDKIPDQVSTERDMTLGSRGKFFVIFDKTRADLDKVIKR